STSPAPLSVAAAMSLSASVSRLPTATAVVGVLVSRDPSRENVGRPGAAVVLVRTTSPFRPDTTRSGLASPVTLPTAIPLGDVSSAALGTLSPTLTAVGAPKVKVG